jgi:hypothetical protein
VEAPRGRAGLTIATALLIGVIAIAVARLASGDESESCHAEVRHGVLPEWARAGFSEREPRLPHVVGRKGEIAGLIFVEPLTSPPPRGRQNKILWVAREPARPPSDLTIRAQRAGGGAPVTRVVEGGPGPSTVDLPAPGCWRLTLRWSGREDTVDVDYAAR